MNYDVIITPDFLKALKRLSKKFPSLQNDLDQLGERLSENPFQGDALGKDCYKVRLAISSKGKGKSGGARVITCIKVVGETIFLLDIYDKSEKANLTNREFREIVESFQSWFNQD